MRLAVGEQFQAAKCLAERSSHNGAFRRSLDAPYLLLADPSRISVAVEDAITRWLSLLDCHATASSGIGGSFNMLTRLHGRAGALDRRYVPVLAAVLLLAGCGGDDSSPAPSNRAPTFTSAASATVAENSAAAFYQAAAADPDGDALAFSLAGGADAGKFTITSSGALSFVEPPNFEAPGDADRDNIYRLEISVTDGKVSATLSLAITVINTTEGVTVRRVASGFVDPVAIAVIDDSTVLLAEKRGAIYRLNPLTGARTLIVQLQNVGDAGVAALAPGLTFASDGTFFVMYANDRGFLLVERYLRNPAGPTVPDNFGAILAANAPQYAGGGWMGVDATGVLYVATGDGGGSGDPTGSAQDDGSILGKLIRVTPNPDPYAGASPVFFFRSTVAKGLHQPNGGAFFQGGLLLADRGQSLADEVNLYQTGRGILNFGWPFKEATRTLTGGSPANLTDPAIELEKGAAAATKRAIVGGAIGPEAIATLRSKYVFADDKGAIYTVAVSSIKPGSTLTANSLERRDADFVPDQGTINGPVMIVASLSALYVLDGDGEIFRTTGG